MGKTSIYISIESLYQPEDDDLPHISVDAIDELRGNIDSLSDEEKEKGVCVTLFSRDEKKIRPQRNGSFKFLIHGVLAIFEKDLIPGLAACRDDSSLPEYVTFSCLDYACPDLLDLHIEVESDSREESLADPDSDQGHSSSDEETRPQNPLATSCNEQTLFASSTKKNPTIFGHDSVAASRAALKAKDEKGLERNPLDEFVVNPPRFGR